MYKLSETSPGVFSITDEKGKNTGSYYLQNLITAIGKTTVDIKLKEFYGKDVKAFLDKLEKDHLKDLTDSLEDRVTDEKFFIKESGDSFDVYGLQTGMFKFSYKTKLDKKSLEYTVSTYCGKNIEDYLKLVEENFISFNSDGTDNYTETLNGFKTKEEIDEIEFKAFLSGANILDQIDYNRTVLDTDFLLELHREMFSATYSWAGALRKVDVQFGNKQGEKHFLIKQSLDNFFLDFNLRILNTDKLNLSELTRLIIDFEYRFITIHPFNNTNGRMSRLLTKAVLNKLGFNTKAVYYDNRESRSDYLKAIKNFDNGDEKDFIDLVHSYLHEIVSE